MRIEKIKLWDDSKADCICYLTENSTEIDPDRKRPAIVICGGGAYMGISEREQEPVGFYFLNQGYQVFILNYTTKSIGNPKHPAPIYDLAKMISIIRSHAKDWHINPDQIACIGFSAGGHLCASIATMWHEPWLARYLKTDSEQIKPNAVILSYALTDFIYELKKFETDEKQNSYPLSMPHTKIKDAILGCVNAYVGSDHSDEFLKEASPYYHISEKTAPSFLWCTAADELVYAGNTLRYAEKLTEYGIPCEVHMFPYGIHGLSMASLQTGSEEMFLSKEVSAWVNLAIAFLNHQWNNK